MPNTTQQTKTGWNFDNSYAQLPEMFFSQLNPVKVAAPELVILNHQLADLIGLDSARLETEVAVLAGNRIPAGAKPLAQAYGGHQFGHFTILGDGRAILIGEQITADGERFDIQLKGSGETPYSRMGDGRATLGPMLREYIISEAMHKMGIPTTRSLAVVKTGEKVQRESYLPGAILTRVASSHLRVGTFQYAAYQGTVEDLKGLADYAIWRHFPQLETNQNKYLALLEEVIRRQAELVAKWQLVGFIHGVMNTDNMTISGETIDYGPCAFMDRYDPQTVFSSIDQHGRYAYGNQPGIAEWNLCRFADTLLPLLDINEAKSIEVGEAALTNFAELYDQNWLQGMRSKLGFLSAKADDKKLIADLLTLMDKYGADYTNTFAGLVLPQLRGEFFREAEFQDWQQLWQKRLEADGNQAESEVVMQRSNPVVIPRNLRVEEALEVAVGADDYSLVEKLIAVISKPYSYSNLELEYTEVPDLEGIPYQTYCGT